MVVVKFWSCPCHRCAITNVVNLKNDFFTRITLRRVRKTVGAGGLMEKGEVTRWSQVRQGWGQ